MKIIDLKGSWDFKLDKEKKGINDCYYKDAFHDSILLPATVSTARKGIPSNTINTGYLTDPYQFEGYTWYSRTIELSDVEGEEIFLVLERTRISHVWVDDCYVGSCDSLCTSHRYRLTSYVKEHFKLTIMIDNTAYKIAGGHMTSKDTQTNWNGITGELCIEIYKKIYLSEVQLYPDAETKELGVKLTLIGTQKATLTALVTDGEYSFPQREYSLVEGNNSFVYSTGDGVQLWSEYNPKQYRIKLSLLGADDSSIDEYDTSFGIRAFKAEGSYFTVNGTRTFLRGKHEALIFPKTGYAPTDLESWLKVLGIAKEYGINHYRFHTCCPPEAAFQAADMLGIYMEPELPFWGTVTEPGEENHDEAAQQYLVEEGYRILKEFGNHPSFVMMSLGNELWGSKRFLNELLGQYKAFDNRHLYTQGSNNFQFMPTILENEDFFCGVRFSGDRLFRGSYAMCDAPQGHIQTSPPNTSYDYDQMIRPTSLSRQESVGGERSIQYGTGTKTVKVDTSEELIPELPVVSHEIGQYAMYPDFTEIGKYTGVLKARNLEEFRRRLEEKGMLSQAERLFQASGRFAAECYKAELETALRSNELAGFQILDLQDFSGQGTALVGILNAFMENKGVITAEEWRQFCSDTVILAELPKLIFHSGEAISLGIKLAYFNTIRLIEPNIRITITKADKVMVQIETRKEGECSQGVHQFDSIDLKLPEVASAEKLTLAISLIGTDISNRYDLWIYPVRIEASDNTGVSVTEDIKEACLELGRGGRVLLYLKGLDDRNSIPGTYCTDFWCYPMFRSISESIGRPVPIGTHGLLIDKEHPIFEHFPTEHYSTAPWYDIVTNSRSLILDDTSLEPIVRTIDNFERNHKLGLIVEMKVGAGRLLLCTSDLRSLPDSSPARWLEESFVRYMNSDAFEPVAKLSEDELLALL